MMHVERILVPADGSAESEAAFAWACDLARYYDAEITLLYIVDTTKLGSLGLPGGPEKPEYFDHEQGKKILQTLCEEAPEGVSVHTVTTEIRDRISYTSWISMILIWWLWGAAAWAV